MLPEGGMAGQERLSGKQLSETQKMNRNDPDHSSGWGSSRRKGPNGGALSDRWDSNR